MIVLHSRPLWLQRTEVWLYNQVRFLPSDVESHIVCTRAANLDQFDLPSIHVLIAENPAWKQYWDKLLRFARVRTYPQFLARQARRWRVDVLHSHFGDVGWRNIEAARRAGVRHVVTFYGRDVNYLPQQDPLWRQRYRDLFASVERVLCEGDHMAGEIIKLGCSPDKVRVQHLGVDVDRIEFRPLEWQPGEPLRVLMAASFQEKKGFPYALEALGRVQDEIPLEITLIGDAGDPAEKRKILDVIAKYRLDSKIRMPGYVSYTTLMDEAHKHHVFLSPSVTASSGDTEGGAPVALIDMTASGMIVVSSAHCDIPQIVLNGRTGLLTAERDVDGLAAHLRWLAQNPQRWAEMRRAGRAHIEQAYHAAAQGRRLAAIYREVIAAPRTL